MFIQTVPRSSNLLYRCLLLRSFGQQTCCSSSTHSDRVFIHCAYGGPIGCAFVNAMLAKTQPIYIYYYKCIMYLFTYIACICIWLYIHILIHIVCIYIHLHMFDLRFFICVYIYIKICLFVYIYVLLICYYYTFYVLNLYMYIIQKKFRIRCEIRDGDF